MQKRAVKLISEAIKASEKDVDFWLSQIEKAKEGQKNNKKRTRLVRDEARFYLEVWLDIVQIRIIVKIRKGRAVLFLT